MAQRTDNETVRKVIETDADHDIQRFITTATALTDYVVSKDTDSVLTTALKLEIETYLAAHFYALAYPQYQSESADGASATYQGQTGMGLDGTWYGQQAIALDISGTLAKIKNGIEKGKAIWLGKAVNEKVDFWDRN